MKYSADPSILQQEDDAQVAWGAIEPFWEDLPLGNARQLLAFMSDLTRGQRGLIAVDWCQKEIRNGGIEQLFLNPTGDLVPWAIEGFQMIGARRYAEILSEAASALGPEYPVSVVERTTICEALKPSHWQRIEDLEDAFFALINSPEHDLERYRGGFVRQNPQEFVKDATAIDRKGS